MCVGRFYVKIGWNDVGKFSTIYYSGALKDHKARSNVREKSISVSF